MIMVTMTQMGMELATGSDNGDGGALSWVIGRRLSDGIQGLHYL